MSRNTLTFAFLIFFFPAVRNAYAQFNELLPVRFSLFTENYPLLNPALINMEDPRSLNTGTQITAGGFDRVYSFYLNGAFTLFPAQKPNQRLGVSFMGDWEGELISRSWFQLMYSIEVPLSSKVKIGTGAHIGLMNYLVKSTNVSAGGSDLAPLLSVGLKIRDDRGHFGIAFNQANRATVTPIEQPIRLNRHINLTATYEFQVSRMFVITPAVWFRWLESDFREYTFSVEGLLDDVFVFQAVWLYERNLTFGVGVKNTRLGRVNLALKFSYTVPFGEEVFDQFNLYEAHVGIKDF